ncbi:DUF4124 domain-containing protein [Psychrobacter sp. DM4]|uniref:DUF4124 domain-containing protein n=1 Tax=Psychrobacter sp. DM4 TaxID=3440637 RepID=UPI003F502A3B
MMTTFKVKSLMNNRALALLAGLVIGSVTLYVPNVNAASIYKVVDEQTGQVTFTDQPQNYEQQTGKQIVETNVSTGNDSSHSASTSSQNNNSSQSNNSTKSAIPVITAPAPINYQLVMTEPSEERAYQRPGQIITVSLQMSPALQTGDSISIYIDGQLISQGITASIATINLNPGEHTIQATIQNSRGQVVNQITRTVYVIQNTAILQNKKRVAQQLQAYQLLPWHQKLRLKMRQNNNASK